jgi:hypothetical protein
MSATTINLSCKKSMNKEPELSKQTIKAIEQARKQIKKGKFVSLEVVKQRLRL